ncbi:hypothetical protein [Kitasatospora sp. MBT66]|uniref:hypothetical protein n=1 Tax=Kitasatospora sp. MBT66 TaxID=1444769 RepID=UPI0005B76C0B|nr:hypothetical protein [Kitasatospora sp. MBT66]
MSRPRSPQRPPTHGPGPCPGLEPALVSPPPGPDGLLLDPGPSVAPGERAGVVAGVTGLAVAVLHASEAGAPLRIDATVETVDGGNRYTGTTAHYADGVTVSVRAHLPCPVPAGDRAEGSLAGDGAGLFAAGALVADGVPHPATGCRAVPGGPVKGWTARVDGWTVTVHGVPDTPAVQLLRPQAGPGAGRTVSAGPALRVPLLDGGGEPRVEPVTAGGAVAAVRSTYDDGTVLWLMAGRVGPDAAARTVFPGETTTPGPEVFVRIDGCTRTAQQRRTAGASARVVDLWGARSRTLVLVTPGRPQGPAPRVLLAPGEGAGPLACGTGALR